MSEQELIDSILSLSKSGIGFPLIFWGAYLLKRYVINGNTRKYLAMRRREIRAIRVISLQLDAILKAHERPGSEEKLNE